MENPYVDKLRGWMIVFFTLGGIVIIAALIAIGSIASDRFNSGSGTAAAIVWLNVGCGIVSFGFLAMLFLFVAGAVDFRLRNPAEPDAPKASVDPGGQAGPVA